MQGEGLPVTLERPYTRNFDPASGAGSYSRLIDFAYHSTLGLRVTKKKELESVGRVPPQVARRAAAQEYQSVVESGSLRAVHLSRQKWPGGLVN